MVVRSFFRYFALDLSNYCIMQNNKQYNIPEDTPMFASEAAIAYTNAPNPERGRKYVKSVRACAFTDSQLRDVVANSLQEVANGNYYTAEQAAAHFMSL